ncbi:hypothetical protein [Devosia aurantiaca]|uniref:Uncharacterized protein n=1 Tax=Devosia aurantiaca TaxID=2714858 RepID=A0A6M1SPW8_9HYPH|nr:hypothetical protein [Devosia aurantiaca]NGP19268.1 hypothetical protein [Devosia aurantiaca]
MTIYAWTTYDDELDEKAIIIGVGGSDASMIAMGLSYVEPGADIYWFSNINHRGYFVEGSEHGFTVSQALLRAEELRLEMGYSRVVITIQERGMWRDEWGALAEREGLS